MSDTSERRGSLKQNFYSTLARVSLLYSWSLVVSINAGRHIKNVPDRKELINLRDSARQVESPFEDMRELPDDIHS